MSDVDVVIGAGGGCGKLCVLQLLKAGGRVRAVGRVSGISACRNLEMSPCILACIIVTGPAAIGQGRHGVTR